MNSLKVEDIIGTFVAFVKFQYLVTKIDLFENVPTAKRA